MLDGCDLIAIKGNSSKTNINSDFVGTINIGLGTISFNRNQIATVQRSEKQEVENNW